MKPDLLHEELSSSYTQCGVTHKEEYHSQKNSTCVSEWEEKKKEKRKTNIDHEYLKTENRTKITHDVEIISLEANNNEIL